MKQTFTWQLGPLAYSARYREGGVLYYRILSPEAERWVYVAFGLWVKDLFFVPPVIR